MSHGQGLRVHARSAGLRPQANLAESNFATKGDVRELKRPTESSSAISAEFRERRLRDRRAPLSAPRSATDISQRAHHATSSRAFVLS